MTSLLELTLPIATTDIENGAVRDAASLFDEYVKGGAVVEISNFGAYGETDHARVLVRGYLDDTPANLTHATELQAALCALPGADLYGELQILALADSDWAEAWKEHYHPLRVGQRLVISPTWEEPETEAGDQVIWLDPGMAFGTGTHASTQLILRLLEHHLRPNSQMLDVGTGSGILAIAALKLGASHVHATDIDPQAVEIAAANAAANQMDNRLSLTVGSVPDQRQYPTICANILADVIADLLLREHLAERLTPDGVLLLSGIIEQRRHVVDLALAAQGLHVIETVRDGDWLALVCQKKSTVAATESESFDVGVRQPK